MLEQCPCFERADDALTLEPKELAPSFRDRGTLLHYIYEERMRGKTSVQEHGLTPNELEGIEWAVDFTKAHINKDYPSELERRLILMDDSFNVVTFGTGDVVNGTRLFDLKTGDYHNYWLQMAIYALAQMDRQGVDALEVILLFTRFKKAIELKMTREECTRRIFKVVEAVQDPDKKPRANPYCRWCRKVMTCEAVVHLLSGVEHDRYEITEPVALSAALKLARILAIWVKRVEDFAKQQAIAGVEIPEFELKSRMGNREIADVKKAYELSGIPPDDFLQLCSIAVGKIEDAISTIRKISKSKAKNLVNEQLKEVIVRRPPTLRLALTNNNEEPIE
jgi:CRISPR/Cas system-associated exonuclease Cas4 (RecB family)